MANKFFKKKQESDHQNKIYVYGRRSFEVLMQSFDRDKSGVSCNVIEKVFYTKAFKKENESLIKKACSTSKNVEEVQSFTIESIVGKNENHQGICAKINYRKNSKDDLKLFLKKKSQTEKVTGVVFDKVSDIANIGSIIRSGFAFDIDFFVIENFGSSKDVSKINRTSSGYFLNSNIFFVDGVSNFLRNQKRNDFEVLGLTAKDSPKSLSLSEMKDTSSKKIFVLGSEHSGLRQTVEKECDFFLKIETSKEIDSLNVSNAASIVFYKNYIN